MSFPIIDRAVNNPLCAYMGAMPQISAENSVTRIFDWWRDAGVHAVVSETPHDWLGVATVTNAHTALEPAMRPALPASHDAFLEWLKTADLPDAGPSNRRLLPSGSPAPLMILADFPEVADIEAGQHMSGALAALFDKMLEALGHDRSSVYFATLCPGRPASGRLSDRGIAELARAAKHHIALAAPRQLWLMGGAASRAVLGIDDAAAKGKLHVVNLDGLIVNAIATAHPRLFEGSKARRAAAWVEMQRLIIEEQP